MDIRVDEVPPRDLGIHSAIPGDEGDDDLPVYVPRDYDFRLRNALGVNGVDRGAFVVMVGGSSTGKTRSLYEAVYELVPRWALVQPADAAELLFLKGAPPRRSVVWLDELQRYLGAEEAHCIRLLRRAGNWVVGTLWPDQYASWTAGRDDVHRLVKTATVVSVPDELSPLEEQAAELVAERDSRVRQALRTRDIGLTQALAGGPALVLCWEQPVNPYVKAIITAAADAHRLGVQSPLTESLLVEAMAGYLHGRQRVRSPGEWLPAALPHATRPQFGEVSALTPADGGRPGRLAGYTVADYLAQHLRGIRRVEPVPHEAWQALVTHLQRPPDLWHIADSALARLRCRYAEAALRRLADEFRDSVAASRLAGLLVRQDRFADAVDVLDADWGDEQIQDQLARTRELRQRVEAIRPRALSGDPAARERLADILLDGGECDDLRQRARRRDRPAAERLVDLLVARGCVREIRKRAELGDFYAAEALCDLYVAWGEKDLLEARAQAGDQAAQLRVSKVHQHRESADAELAELRAAVDDGNPEAGPQLCALLFELRDETRLKAELNAGTAGAADRLIALYMALDRFDPGRLARLHGYGFHADGRTVHP
ncbi:hypothetical protein M1L60_14455 [Actinoplanes sp. TRM 88003]|uniref:Uncharacterized protein n=1 Tax=Paractinoplanes aksuensis TaxID=2939490 RepID=A0ABT1DPY0_9ACTN|nr:hypothetical protein [Actinoplanes aksuensis]MCO8271796.1 hypothetical protein [Actinoplanes aksuensis]